MASRRWFESLAKMPLQAMTWPLGEGNLGVAGCGDMRRSMHRAMRGARRLRDGAGHLLFHLGRCELIFGVEAWIALHRRRMLLCHNRPGPGQTEQQSEQAGSSGTDPSLTHTSLHPVPSYSRAEL
jgi:hypothetical protein